MWTGNDYDFLMGRWSRKLGKLVAEYAGVKDGENVLDVGCGTGALTGALLDIGPSVRVTGIDGSADFIEIGRKNIADGRLRLDHGDAQSMPYNDDSFDNCVSQLVMNFIPDPRRAVEEMMRVTRPGGTITAAVWDYGDGMEMLRILWDEAEKIDESAGPKHERNNPLCRQGELAELWRGSGLSDVDDSDLTMWMNFSSFDDYWNPYLTGIGPSGSYVSGLEPETRGELRECLRRRLTNGNDGEPFSLSAKVWAVRGRVT